MRQPLFYNLPPPRPLRSSRWLSSSPLRVLVAAIGVVVFAGFSLAYAVTRVRIGADYPVNSSAAVIDAAPALNHGHGSVLRFASRAGESTVVRATAVREDETAATGLVTGATSHADSDLPRVLILTPVKNSAKHLGRFFRLVGNLTYPLAKLSLGILDSDSDDAIDEGTAEKLRQQGYTEADLQRKDQHGHSMSGTVARILSEVPALQNSGWHSVTLVRHDFNYSLPRASRHGRESQRPRRAMLARSRNHLVNSALRDEEWVLWIDSDLQSYPPNILQKLLASGKDIVCPNAVMEHGGRSYDLNSWRARSAPGNNATAKQVVAYWDKQLKAASEKGVAHDELWLEGYGDTGNLYLHKLKHEGKVVRLDGVGGAMLLVRAELHRQGLVFPPVVYRHRIETEGLSMMGLDMGVLSWGMPHLEIIHR